MPRGQNYLSNPATTDIIPLLAIAQLQPVRTWFSLLERSLWHAQKLRRVAAADPGLRIVRTAGDLEAGLAARRAGKVQHLALLSIEGMHNLEGRFENLDVLFAAGFRMGGLAHFFDNELAGSMHGERKGGLTPFGRKVVAAMEDKGMIVDVAHASHATVADVLAIARKPVVFSHGGVKGTCDTNRNLTDDEIRGIARTGGVIGIGLWDVASCSDKPAGAAKAMRYVRDLVGIEAVALGSDFDGAVAEPIDVSGLDALTQALLDEGFTPDEVRAAMGGNAIRVLRADLPGAEARRGAVRRHGGAARAAARRGNRAREFRRLPSGAPGGGGGARWPGRERKGGPRWWARSIRIPRGCSRLRSSRSR